ncbi:MAG: hypothetical protein NTY01_01255 [Verrucomicrobia bacterium]|nr:hypothetical protein [Verrucomicrobiota bacterium]
MMTVVAVLMFAGLSRADSVTIVSPDLTETYACGHVEQAKFEWVNEDAELYANVTFSNGFYAGDGEAPSREYFLFKFPGVTYDRATKTFYAQDNEGHSVPVAVMQAGLIGHYIKPMPGTCVYISNSGGTVQLILTATTNPRPSRYANHWVPCGEINLQEESLATRSRR